MDAVVSERRKVCDTPVHRVHNLEDRIESSMDLMLTEFAAPTVVGSHMSLLRPTTPRLSGDRRNGKPGEVRSPASTKRLRC